MTISTRKIERLNKKYENILAKDARKAAKKQSRSKFTNDQLRPSGLLKEPTKTNHFTKKQVMIAGAGVAAATAAGAVTLIATKNPALAAKVGQVTRTAIYSHVRFSAVWGGTSGTVHSLILKEERNVNDWSKNVVNETARIAKSPTMISVSLAEGLFLVNPLVGGIALGASFGVFAGEMAYKRRQFNKDMWGTVYAPDVTVKPKKERDDRFTEDGKPNPEFDWNTYMETNSTQIWNKYFAQAVEESGDGAFSEEFRKGIDTNWWNADDTEMLNAAGFYVFHKVPRKKNANALYAEVLADFHEAYRNSPVWKDAVKFATIVANAQRTAQRAKATK